jgi:trehalose-6-phosphate synthase
MIDGVEMPVAERRARHARFLERVTGWTARDWLTAQLDDLAVGAVLAAS